MILAIEIPLPGRELSPNASRKLHWGRKAVARNRAKQHAEYATRSALGRREAPQWARTRVEIVCRGPTQIDQDNLVAWLKASLDAIAATLKLNDRTFVIDTPKWEQRGARQVGSGKKGVPGIKADPTTVVLTLSEMQAGEA